jgi:hypothetical protein
MDAWEQTTLSNPMGQGRLSGLCLVHLTQGMMSINIKSIRALESRKGQGTDAMHHIIRLADNFGVDLILAVGRFGRERRMNNTQLFRWYRTFGFRRVQRTHHMFRKAQPLENLCPISSLMQTAPKSTAFRSKKPSAAKERSTRTTRESSTAHSPRADG